MEIGDGTLRWVGCLAEADGDLHCRSDGCDQERGHGAIGFRCHRHLATFTNIHAKNIVRIGLESGARSAWLWTELKKMGMPIVCIDARHAKAALKMQINKNDRNDAAGIARIMQTGWYPEVRVKDLDSHAIRPLLASWALLVKVKRDLENQISGLKQDCALLLIIGVAVEN